MKVCAFDRKWTGKLSIEPEATMSSQENEHSTVLRMEEILCRNWKATLLLRSLLDFFDAQIDCEMVDDDGQPNQHSVLGITGPNEIGDVSIAIKLRRNSRSEEALVHELLHSNMIPLGYPVFWLDEQECTEWNLGRDILNSAEHQVMLPMFLQLGYSEDRFLGPSDQLCAKGERIMTDLEAMKKTLSSPTGFMRQMSGYLTGHGIQWQLVQGVAAAILKRRLT